MALVGNDLLDSGRLHPRARMGLDLTPARRSSRCCSTASWSRYAVRCRGAPVRASCWPTCARPACRAALVTMSWRRFAEPVLAALPEDSFEVVVTGDEVDHGKPHPEPYLRAAALLGLDPQRLRRDRGLPARRGRGRGRRVPHARGAAPRSRPGRPGHGARRVAGRSRRSLAPGDPRARLRQDRCRNATWQDAVGYRPGAPDRAIVPQVLLRHPDGARRCEVRRATRNQSRSGRSGRVDRRGVVPVQLCPEQPRRLLGRRR